MNESEILEFIRLLDKQVSKDVAIAKFKAFGEVALYANREGYLRMGIELLKCAFNETSREADLSYLFTKDSDFGIDHLATNEDQLNFFAS
jgi:hypothetical protein